MTRERIEDMRETVLPFVKKTLLKIDYEGHGKSDAEEFEKDFNELLNIAIKALEQEPCEDAISRQAALVAMRNNYRDGGRDIDGDYVEGNYNEKIYDVIMSLPPVTPQPKIGKWIFVDRAHEHAHCSECDYGNVDLLDGRPHNYCPNCGAKMQTESEE